MKRSICIAAVLAALLAIAPAALADDGHDHADADTPVTTTTTTTTETPAQTTTSTGTSGSGSTSSGSDTSSGTDTSSDPPSDPPACTTNCEPPACTVNCEPPACTVDCIPDDTPCLDAVACGDGPVAGEGRGPAARAAGGALPYTGIEDVLLPLLIGAMAMLAGIVAYRFATVKDMVTRARESAGERRRGGTGYTRALENIEADEAARSFWGGRSSSAA